MNQATKAGCAEAFTLVGLLAQRAERERDQLAYTFLRDGEHDAQSLTYGELDRHARMIAASLRERARPGERAIVLLPPGLDFIAAFFGCLYAGLTAVPVPLPEGKRGLARLSSIVRDCGPVAALTTREVFEKLMVVRRQATSAALASLAWCTIDTLAPSLAEACAPFSATPSDLAFLQYTSGSTGTPKGVVLTHGNLIANERMIQHAFGHTAESVIVGWLPPYHDMGLIGNILQPLYVGAHCIQMAPQHFLTKPLRWLSAISRYRATTSGAPNFAYEMCVSKIAPEQREGLDLSSWTLAFNGAETVRSATLDRFVAAFRDHGFQRSALFPCYGLAEATLFVSGAERAAGYSARSLDRESLAQGRAAEAHPNDQHALSVVSCGRAARDSEIRIVDPNTLAPCAEQCVGEVWVRGPSVAQAYWGNEEDSERTFRARLSSGDGPYLRTGDLGYLDGGDLYLAGRLKDLIIVRGRNLYPQDIEQTAEGVHPLLRSGGGAAFACEEDGEERLVLVHEVGKGSEAELVRIAEALRREIAERHEVTLHTVVFIRPSTLPRTTSGKVQRRACRDAYLSRALTQVFELRSDGDAASAAADEDEPLSALEAELADVWCEVLGRSRVGRHDDFLRLGGDSLQATQISARVSERFAVEMGPGQLFESPTLASLATWLETERRSEPAAPTVGKSQARCTERIPLSPVQERLWFLDQLVGRVPVYHLANALRLEGALDISAFERSLALLVERHDALRTTFGVHEGVPFQRVSAAAGLGLPFTDLSSESETVRETLLAEALRQEACTPFDLSQTAVRVRLLRLGHDIHVFALTVHHLIADGWSLSLFVRELAVAYRAFSAGREPAFEAPRLTHAQHVLAQRSQLDDHAYELAVSHWRQHLSNLGPPLTLPTDRPRPASRTYAGARLELALPVSLVRDVGQLARREGSTKFAVFLTAFAVLLRRYADQADLCIGTPVAARARTALEHVFGCLLNTFALRIQLSADLTVHAALTQVRAALAGAQAHQHVPFERVLSRLPMARSAGLSPLFQVMFTMRPPLASFDAPGLQAQVLEVNTGTAQFDLALDIAADGEAPRAIWEYDTDLFDAPSIEQLARDYQHVLNAMVSAMDARIFELALDSHEQGIADGGLQRIHAHELCAHEIFEQRARLTPGAVALVHGDIRLTYAALDARATSFARRLRALGVAAETRVALYLERSPDLVAAALAVLKAGGGYVPIDPSQPMQRVEHMLDDADVALTISHSALLAKLPRAGSRVLCVDIEDDAQGAAPLEPMAHPSRDRLAYIIYTSGSTGRPKGVMVSQRTLSNAVSAWQHVYALPGEDVRLLQLASPAFDVWTADWSRALCTGGVLVLATPEIILDPAALTSLMRRERITVADMVPSLIKPLVAHWREQGESVESLRLLVVGSETWSMQDHDALRAQCPVHMRLLSCYGVTESTIDSAWFEASRDSAAALTHTVPLGRPFPNTRMMVLDTSGWPVPPGVPGELYLAGAGIARGYVRRPDLTAERFVPDPWSTEPGARMYRTGDRVRRHRDGTLEFLGRVDHQIKVRGLRVEVGEIEARLAAHPRVREALVMLRGTAHEARLVAYLVRRGRDTTSPAELRDFLRRDLPESMVPSAFIWLEAFPLNANGKVDRAALAAPGQPVPEPHAHLAAPQSELEASIAEVWRDVLGVPRVDVHDNFFDLGGHSLLLGTVLHRLRAKLPCDVQMLTLFEHPTVATLAQALAGAARGEPSRESDARESARAQLRRAESFARRRTSREDEP